MSLAIFASVLLTCARLPLPLPIPTTASTRSSVTVPVMREVTIVDEDVVNGAVEVDTAVMDVAEAEAAVVRAVVRDVAVKPTADVATKSRRASFDDQWVFAELTHYPAPPGGECTPGHGGVYQDASQLGQLE